MSGKLTAVPDTCYLVSLALPLASNTYDHKANPEPLKLFFSSYTVTIPNEVHDELSDIKQGSDIEAQAADILLQMKGSAYAVEDPYNHKDAPNSRPNWRIDEGETDAVVHANAQTVDVFFSDDFKSKSVFIAQLQNQIAWKNSPLWLAELYDASVLSKKEARAILDEIEAVRNWKQQPYVQSIRMRRL